MSGVQAFRLIVRGRVQRVGFRRYVLETAQELGLTGYVKNLPDGSVEVYAQGERGLLEKLVERVKDSPPPSKVREVLVEEASPKPELGVFRVEFGSLAEELQEGFGAMQSIFMEYWREFKDYRSEFKDYRGEFKDFRGEFEDFRGEFRDYRQEFRGFARRTDENFKLLMGKYGEISEKLTVILETLVRESKETREQLAKAVAKLTEAVEALKNASKWSGC